MIVTGTQTQTTQSNTLKPTAETLRGFGFSIIPLTANSKQAAISWKTYQQRHPTSNELAAWFETATVTNIGIITGRISRLVVLDIDRHDRLNDLVTACTDLLQTLTVRTRRGYHLYYRIPEDVHVPTQRADGIDLQGEGAYVVAAGSVIDGYTYQFMDTSRQPRQLSERDLNRLLHMMNRCGRQNGSPITRQPLEAATDAREPALTGGELVGLYRSAASRDGRNQTLFRLACLARDHGWSQAAATDLLLPEHIHYPPSSGHVPETPHQRHREGRLTIASAFSRPPRPVRQQTIPGLPNNVREELFRLKLTNIVRVVEGLRHKGIQPGETITRGRAVELLRGVVGRDNVYAAFNTALPAGEPVFSPQTPHSYAASDTGKDITSKCFEVDRKSSGKSPSQVQNPAHRPAEVFIMPSNHALANRLNLPFSAISDPLELDDLKQAHITRQRYHEYFLRRRPGQYPIGLFAHRLGVTARTIRNYHRQNPAIRSEIRLQETLIGWWNVDVAVPDELPHKGFWLMDEKGRGYPARVEIARVLLAKKRRISLFRRLPNYWYVEGYRPEIVPEAVTQVKVSPGKNVPQLVNGTPAAAAPQPAATVQPPSVRPSDKKRGRVEQPKPPRIASGKRKLKDVEAEACAQRVYRRINALSQDREGCISVRSARRLVERYGIWRTEQALERVARREGVYKPVGLLTTILRSEDTHQSM
jgi:hypothetical protein